jgi:hypothetical protein
MTSKVPTVKQSTTIDQIFDQLLASTHKRLVVIDHPVLCGLHDCCLALNFMSASPDG